ncbi:MAG: hypothetical protein ABL934_13995 [Lysobacteraceae bacterium]
MRFIAYFNFNGNCRAAFDFYREVFNGEIQMPLQETFWAHRWASFTDRFGKPWMINCMKEV